MMQGSHLFWTKSTLRQISLFLVLVLVGNFAFLPMLHAQERPTTWQHFKNLPKAIGKEGLITGVAHWLKEDWQMTVQDAKSLAARVGNVFSGAKTRLRKFAGLPKEKVLAAIDFGKVEQVMTDQVGKLDKKQVGEITGQAINSPEEEEVQRTFLKRKVTQSVHEGEQKLRDMPAAEFDQLVIEADKTLDRALSAPTEAPKTHASGTYLPQLFPNIAKHLPEPMSNFMQSDASWVLVAPLHLLLCGLFVTSIAEVGGVAAVTASVFTICFFIGGAGVSWVAVAAAGTVGVLAFRLIRAMVGRRR